jgi:hypothetical protein
MEVIAFCFALILVGLGGLVCILLREIAINLRKIAEAINDHSNDLVSLLDITNDNLTDVARAVEALEDRE